jgi:hypothetical protein
MYQTSDTKMRRKGEPSARLLRRGAALLLSAVSLAVILLGSAAYALNVECPLSIGGEPCIGTDGADVMRGTDGLDSIVGLGGNDVMHGLGAPDRLTGKGNDTVNAVEGQRDVIDCGPGRDSVQFDVGLDTVKRCEIKEAI